MISAEDLAKHEKHRIVRQGHKGWELSTQYSSDNKNWHDEFDPENDKFVRVSSDKPGSFSRSTKLVKLGDNTED